MMKMKLPPPSPSVPADGADQNAEIETLRRELDARKRQLRKLLQQKAEEVRRAMQIERSRSVKSLSNLRERLHQEKVAELAKQKDTLARSFELQLLKLNGNGDPDHPSSGEGEAVDKLREVEKEASPASLPSLDRTEDNDQTDNNTPQLPCCNNGPLRAALATMEDIELNDDEGEECVGMGAKLTTWNKRKRTEQAETTRDFCSPAASYSWESPPCDQLLLDPANSQTRRVDDIGDMDEVRQDGRDTTNNDDQERRIDVPEVACSDDATFAKMADLLSQLRHREEENLQLSEQLKKMESLHSSLQVKNRDYCRQNVELISANRKLNSKVKQMTANNAQMKQELDSVTRHQLQEQLLHQQQQQQQQQQVASGPWYLHPPKEPSPPHHVIEATQIEEEDDEEEEEPEIPSPKKMSPWRTSSVPWSNKDRWWAGDGPPSCTSSMAPIIEEEEESDWWEEKTRLNQENLALSVKVNALEQLQAKLEAELREARDQTELQEFRILELEECNSSSSRDCLDATTNTIGVWDCPTKPQLGKSGSSVSIDEGMQDSFKEEKLEELLAKLQMVLETPLDLSLKAEGLLVKTMPRLMDLGHQKLKESHESDWWLDLPHQGSGDDGNDKLHRLEDYAAVLRLENKHLSMKVAALEKHLSMMLSSGSRDSPTEVSDSRSDIVSQGGETGYSSDDSIDAEELYHLSVSGGSNVHSPSLSLDGSESHMTPFRLEYEDILHKISGLNVETSDVKIAEGVWKMDVSGRVKQLELAELKLKEDVERLVKHNEQLMTEKSFLHRKCAELEEVEIQARRDEQSAQNRLQDAFEMETNLRESIEKLEEKDRQQSSQMELLEQAKAELEQQVSQLSKAVESYVQKINTLESSQDLEEHSANMAVPNSSQQDSNCSDVTTCADVQLASEPRTPQSVKSECSIMSDNLKNLFSDDSIVISSFASFQGVADFSRLGHCKSSDKLDGAMTNSLLQISSDSIVNSDDCAKLLFVYVDDSDMGVDAESVKFDSEKLNKLFTEKEEELRRKETEYLLKMEALKCDHDETVMRLEGRLEAVLKSEIELREQVETLLAVKKSLEVSLKNLDRESEMEKTSLASQIDELQSAKAKLESKLREHTAPSAARLYIGCEEVYEDRDEAAERSYSPSKIKEGAHRKKIRDLENHLQLLRMEVEQPSNVDLSMQCDASTAFKSCDQVGGNLIEKLNDLSRSESRLRQRIFELEKKEVAYRETLQEADKIMADVEQSYQERVEELELSEEKLRGRIVQLEQSEKRLRQALRNSNRNSEVAKFGELLDRLLETEASEQRLKGRIHELEQHEADLKHQLSSTERERLSVEGELKDQEELVQSVLDLKRTETELRARIEELETSESALRETLSQADVILAERESDLQHKMADLETELEAVHQMNHRMKEDESKLKSILDEKEERLALLEKKVYDDRDEDESREPVNEALSDRVPSPPSVFVPSDADGRFPPSMNRSSMDGDPRRARIMTEILEENVRLELQTLELQNTNEKLRKQLLDMESRNACFRSESNVQQESQVDNSRYLEMNLEILAKDSRIESLQDRIRALETGNLPAELQSLSLHGDELKELKEKINSMSAFVQNCNCCNCSNCQPLLHDIENQIELLDAIISGSCTPLEMREDQNNQEVLVTGLGNFSKDIRISNKKEGFASGKVHSDESPVAENEDKGDPKNIGVDNVGSASSLLTTTNLYRPYSSSLVAPVTPPPSSPKVKKQPPPVPPKPPTPLHLLHLRKQQNKTEELVRVLRHQTTQLENELFSKRKELIDANEEIAKLQSRLRFKEKEAKEASIAHKQMRDLEHKVLTLNKQVRILEQSHNDNNSLREKVQELETELQKRKGNERKLYAENLHLHHKVEAQRERINSLQVIKKDYKSMMAKYETLEKKSKKAEQAVTPLKTRVVQLTKKCKERDEEINRLNRQNLRNSAVYSPGRKTRGNKRSDEESSVEEMELLDDNCVCMFNALRNGSMGLSDMNSSSASSDTCDPTIPHSIHCSPRKYHINGPKSRIPRFTALSSPLSSPRQRPSINDMVSSQPSDNSPQETPSRPFKTRFLSSPRLQSGLRETPVMQPTRRRVRHAPTEDGPEPPTNFRVTRRVGQDSLLVAWTVPQPDTDATREEKRVSGYQIYVNGQLQQKVRSPNRTKALLNSLDLSQSLEIAIHSVCESGAESIAAQTTYTAADANGLSDDSDVSSPPSSARSLDDNQNVMKRKCLVRHDFDPRMHSPSQSDPSFELCLQAGDLVTVYGQSQANGFFYGEANGQRGLILADAVEELPCSKLSGSRFSTERSVHTD